MITMNELVDLRMQQHIAHEIYRQQIMQRIPDPFPPMLPIPMPRHVIMPPRVTLPGVEATLQNDDLWKQFHQIGTEMIITKSGRRMFPSMRLSLAGLEDDSNYCVLLEMVPIGDCRYKFSGSQWVPAGGAEPQSPQRMYLHPDSPATGAHWQAQPILFNKVKLTNNTLDNNGHIVLASMHKYQPRLHVICTADLTQIPWAPQQAFVFPETEFVAVTAYQNDRITKLKIDNNPFAKGFRETGQSRCKRKMSSSPSHEDQQRINQQQSDQNDQRTSSSNNNNNNNNNNSNMSPISPSAATSSSAICSSDKTTTTSQRLLNDFEDGPRIKRMRSNGSACSIASFDEVVAGASVAGGADLSSSNSMSSGQSSPNLLAAQVTAVNNGTNMSTSSQHLDVGCTTTATTTSSSTFMHHFQQNMQSLLRPSLVDLACSYFGRPQQPVYAPLHMYNNVTFGVGREMHDVGFGGIGLAASAAAVLPIQLPEHLSAPLSLEVPPNIGNNSSALSPTMRLGESSASEQLNSTETPASRQTPAKKKGFSISAILDGSS